MIAPRSNNPLKFVSDYGDVSTVLLLQRSEAFMDAPSALREAFQDAQDSYLAHINAMHASVLKVIDLLEESTAEQRTGVPESLWPWAETRRLRQMLQRHANQLAALRQGFRDGEGPIVDIYSKTYRAQMETLRDDRGASGDARKKG